MAHTASCYCIEFAPNGRCDSVCVPAAALRTGCSYLTLGGADAIVTLWDTSELIAVKAFDSMLHAVSAIGLPAAFVCRQLALLLLLLCTPHEETWHASALVGWCTSC